MTDRTYLQHNGKEITNPQERAAMQVIEARLDGIAADLSEMKAELRTVASGMERVIRLEEGRTQHAEALGRAFGILNEHEKRIIAIENEMPMTKMVRGWVIAGVIGIVSLLGLQVIGLSMALQSAGAAEVRR